MVSFLIQVCLNSIEKSAIKDNSADNNEHDYSSEELFNLKWNRQVLSCKPNITYINLNEILLKIINNFSRNLANINLGLGFSSNKEKLNYKAANIIRYSNFTGL